MKNRLLRRICRAAWQIAILGLAGLALAACFPSRPQSTATFVAPTNTPTETSVPGGPGTTGGVSTPSPATTATSAVTTGGVDLTPTSEPATAAPTSAPATNTSQPPTATPAPPTPTPTPCLPYSQYVQDVTIPDGTLLAPGQAINKVWQVRSAGCANWPAGTSLVRVGGVAMGADSAPVAVPARGGVANITVPIQAPLAPGNYRSLYRLRSPYGYYFGETLTVVINVPVAPTAAPTNTPVPTSEPATINYFQSSAYNITPGQCVDISWSVENAQAVFYQGNGVTGEETRHECPSATTFYDLRVQNHDDTEQTQRIAVVVSSATPPANGAPQIEFTASATQIAEGDCVTIGWNVENVQAVYYQGNGVVGHSATQECPSSTTTYELRVILRDGSTQVRQVTVQVGQ